MKKRHSNKKGFTLIELVIVIAVIGVLAGILVPTIISLTSSAKFSQDLATVSNINKTYTVDKLDKKIKRYDTMHDALNEISDNNFKISTLQHPSTKDMTIGWDSVNDMFVLINTKEGTIEENKKSTPIANKSDYFIICDVMPTDPEFSVYLTNKNDIGKITHLKVGFDSGDNYSVTRVIYDRRSEETGLETRSVIYRTNPGTDFECYGYVDSSSGEGDIIYHYGESCDSIIDCADGSFYEKGASNHVEVKKGHFVLTNNSFVSYINASATNGNVSVDFLNGSTHGTATNTNTSYGVNIHLEEKAKALNAFYNHHGGPLNVIYDTRPNYTNQTDKNEIIDGKPFVLEGLGSQIRELPHYGEPCEKNGHTFIAVQNYTLRVCEICGSYEHSVYRPSDDDKPSTTTYINRHEGDDYYVAVNSTPDHEHAYGDPVWSWTGYTKAIARFECGDLDCNENITFTYEGSGIERVLVTKENCTQDGVYDHTASCEFNNHEYQSTSPYPEIVERLGHDLHHHEGHNPSCTEDGYSAYDECVREGCDYTTYQKIEASGHSPKEPVQENYVDSTCTAEGHYDLVVYCDKCGVELSRETKTIPMKKHNGNPCTVCGFSTLNIKLLHTDEYIYKVGTDGEVGLETFYDNIPDGPNVTFETLRGNAALTSSPSDTMLTFAGEGTLTLRVNGIQPLKLEVVSGAKNVTTNSVTSATDKNVVLLSDIKGSFNVSGGYTLFGNGFKCTIEADQYASDLASGFINLENGTLDNIQINCPILSDSILYTNQRGQPAYTSPNNVEYYYNTKSAVTCTGESKIYNSYIHGGRAALHIIGGNTLVENTTFEGGVIANVMIGSSVGSVSLNNVTTIQKPEKATVNDTSKTLIGFGILSIVDDSNQSAKIELKGTLRQYNWVNASSKAYISNSLTSPMINTIMKKTEYVHEINGVNSVNSGILFLNLEANQITQPGTVNDQRENKASIPYSFAAINGIAYVYSYENSKGTAENLITNDPYKPNSTMVVPPELSVSGLSDTFTMSKSFDKGAWQYTATATVATKFSFSSQLSISKFGQNLDYVIFDSNGQNISKNETLNLNNVSTRTYRISATYEDKTYDFNFVVQAKVEKIEKPKKTINYGEGLCVASSYGGTWSGAAPALQGITITYYSSSQKEYVDLDLATLTSNLKAGKQNGTNNTWTYNDPNGDFTLTLTGGQVHSKNKVNAMPVVCDGKLYFVASSTSGLVNSSPENGPRSIPVDYAFEANGDTLNFSNTWSVAENKDAEYKYTDFVDGTLTKLEESSGGGGCFASGTLITLADGSQKAIENITQQDKILAWDFNKGCYVASDIFCVTNHGEDEYKIAHLVFSDGSNIEIISEHGMFDATTNRFENITTSNASDFVGHEFIKRGANDEIIKVLLKGVEIVNKVTSAYSIISANYLNVIANEYWTLDPSIYFLLPFEINNDYMFDAEAMANDIETYGLMEYAECEQYAPFMTEGQFNAVSGKYVKIAIGKGIITMDEIVAFAQRILIDQQYIIE